MGVSAHHPQHGQGFQTAGTVIRRVVVDKVVVEVTEDALAVNHLFLNRVAPKDIDARAYIYTIANHALIADARPVGTDVTNDAGSLNVAPLGVLPAEIRGEIRRAAARGKRAGSRVGINFRGRRLNAEVHLPPVT